MAENVFRRARKASFTTVYRSVAQDKRISLKARGLFLLMQSLPEDWEYTISGLATVAGTGKDQIRSALKELSETGYLVKEQGHSDTGKFSGNVFILQDEAPPLLGNPTTVFPTTEKPSTENPTQQKKIITKEDNNKPPISPQGTETAMLFDRFWSAYPKKKDKQDAMKAWRKLAPDMDLCRKMSAALAQQKTTDEWTRERGRYIPYPASWLNGRRWEDEPDEMPSASQGTVEEPEGVEFF